MIIIDFSNLVWTHWYGNQTRYIDSLLEHFIDLKLRFDGQTVLALDSRAQWKYDLYPKYKAGRRQAEHDPRPDALRACKEVGYRCVFSPGNEADDVIATLISQAPHRKDCPVTHGASVDCVVGHECPRGTIVTRDRDLWQLLGPGVQIWDPIDRKLIGCGDVAKAFSVQPTHIRLVKALWGDSSDNLPNAAPRMQKRLLPVIKKTDGSWDHFVREIVEQSAMLSSKQRAILARNRHTIELNWKLAGLNMNCDIKEDRW